MLGVMIKAASKPAPRYCDGGLQNSKIVRAERMSELLESGQFEQIMNEHTPFFDARRTITLPQRFTQPLTSSTQY